MKTLFSLALLVSAVAAQTSSACAADYIVETCLQTETDTLNLCGTNDWDCKCAAYNAIVTCYNNCPNDPRRDQATGQQEIFCSYASQFPSASPKAAPQSAPASTAATTTAATTGASQTGSATDSATGAAKSNSAADLAINAGGVLAAVAGVVAAVL